MTKYLLKPDVRVTVEYSDDTRFGGALSPKLQESFRSLYRPIYQALEEYGPEYVLANSVKLVGNVRGEPVFDTLRDPADRMRVAPDVLYPDPALIKPAVVHLEREAGGKARLVINDEFLRAIHDAIAILSGDPDARPENESICEQIAGVLFGRGLLSEGDACAADPLPGDCTFIGHNAVVVRSAQSAVLIDPWLPPKSERFGRGYQPIVRGELGKIDAILITHSHPDHFDPGTLLQFNRETVMVVPRCDRESLLSADLNLRLRELGFTNLKVLDWWQSTTVGDIEITALPFYGEQPTTGDQICSEVRNCGNTYLTRTPTFSCALIADSGRDRDGDVRDVALECFRKFGAIDVLFTGYRGWSLYPIQYFESSVRQYLFLVPQYLHTVRQSIMNNVSEAVDTAEAWHARFLVPYGDGGAPWYAEMGLGPDPLNPAANSEWLHFDPPPERCLDEMRARTSPIPGVIVPSPVAPLLLRPGQSFELMEGTAKILEVEGHRWPVAMGATA